MTILIIGATGMTGRFLVEQLLDGGHMVRAVVRSADKFSKQVRNNSNLEIIEVAILDLSNEEMVDLVKDCYAIVSCLGHVMDFKGIFGSPRKLCTEATSRLCQAIKKNNSAKLTKFILMNSVGVANPDCPENRTWVERGFLTLLRHSLPPHRDNEKAVEILHRKVGKNNHQIEWCSVRPDSLINDQVSSYEIKASPTTGVFSGRPTTRANVAHFMVALIENVKLWDEWKFRMPVIMNSSKAF